MSEAVKLAYYVVVAGVPWLVCETIARSAAHAVDAGVTRALWRLRVATAIAWIVAFAWPPAWPIGALAAFALLAVAGAWPAMMAMDRAATRRMSPAGSHREASLRRRKVRDYIPLAALAVPFTVTVAGLVATGWALLGLDVPRQRAFLATGLAVCGVVFYALYLRWLIDETRATVLPGAPGVDERDRASRLRRVYAAQSGLVTVMLGSSTVLARVDVGTGGPVVPLVGLAATIVAVLGCAYAISSGLATRQMTEIASRPQPR
jgi:hypothetical protein